METPLMVDFKQANSSSRYKNSVIRSSSGRFFFFT